MVEKDNTVNSKAKNSGAKAVKQETVQKPAASGKPKPMPDVLFVGAIALVVGLLIGASAAYLLTPVQVVEQSDEIVLTQIPLPADAASNVEAYIRSILPGTVTVQNVQVNTYNNSLYKVDFEILDAGNVQSFLGYATLDGPLLFIGSGDFPSTYFGYDMSIGLPEPPPESGPEPNVIDVNAAELAGNSASKGSESALITIIEFADFECPYCEVFYSKALSQIVEQYIETGKARLVFKHFPLGFHEFAQKASEASECAREQDSFWEYHDTLFENQSALDIASLQQYAVDLGLDSEQFNECLESGKFTDAVVIDTAIGQSIGVSGTPAFVVNDEMLVGAQPFSAFQEVIERKLAEIEG